MIFGLSFCGTSGRLKVGSVNVVDRAKVGSVSFPCGPIVTVNVWPSQLAWFVASISNVTLDVALVGGRVPLDDLKHWVALVPVSDHLKTCPCFVA